MVNEELYRCIAKVMQQTVDEKNLNDWIFTLSENDLITGRKLKELRKQIKLIKLEELLMNCCEIINDSEQKLELLTEAFNDEDCLIKGISTGIILKLFETGEVSESLIWMVDNWNELRISVPLREKASRLCPGLSQDNWPLDFIYHMLTTENSYASEQFIQDVKNKFQSMESESSSTASTEPVNMDVEPSTDDLMPSNFESPSFPQNSSFSHLDYDRNKERQEREQSMSSPQQISRDFSSRGQSAVQMTTEDIRRDVTHFDTYSSTMGWEMVSKPDQPPHYQPDNYKSESEGKSRSPSLQHMVNEKKPISRLQQRVSGKEVYHDGAPTDSDAELPENTPGFNAELPDNALGFNAELPDSPLEATVEDQSNEMGLDSQNKSDSTIKEELNLAYNSQYPAPSTDLHMETTQDGRPSTMDIQPTHPEVQVHTIPDPDADTRTRNEYEGVDTDKNDANRNTDTTMDEADRHESSFSDDTTASESIQKSKIVYEEDQPADDSNMTGPKTYASAVSLNIVPCQTGEKISTEEMSKSHESLPSTSQKELGSSQALPRSDELPNDLVRRFAEVAGHHLTRSSSETSSTSDEESNSLDMLSTSYRKLEEYKFNLMFMATLAFPKEERILAKWPIGLISFLSNYAGGDQELVDNFALFCLHVIETTKPMEKEYVRAEGKIGKAWIRSNLELIQSSSGAVVMLYRVVWPRESVHEDTVHQNLLEKKKKKDRLKAFCDALIIISQHKKENLPVIRKEDTGTHFPSHHDENSVTTEEGACSIQETDSSSPEMRKEVAKTLRIRLRKRVENVEDDLKDPGTVKPTATKTNNPDGTVQHGSSSVNTVHAEKDAERNVNEVSSMKTPKHQHLTERTDPKIPSETENREIEKLYPVINQDMEVTKHAAMSTREKHANVDQDQSNDDAFHDALENFESTVAMFNGPTNDGSFELRVVFTDFSPDQTSIYVRENCWYQWKSIPLTYNSQRNYYFVNLPLPPHELEFQYKYFVHVEGYESEWEILYNCDENHQVRLNKDVRYIHDVPVFHLYQGQTLQGLIRRDFHVHLPCTNNLGTFTNEGKHSFFSFRREIISCVNQMKVGWQTSMGNNIRGLMAQEIDIILLKWLDECRKKLDRLSLFYAALCLVIALHKASHRMFEYKLLSVLSQSLTVHCFTEIHQKEWYTLIKREFAADNDCSPFVICEALLAIYRQLKIVQNSPCVDWMLTLPLYWVVANDGDVKQKPTSPRRSGSDLYIKSSLPEANGLSWSDVREICKNAEMQKAMISIADLIYQIHEVHPWITGTYMYFLSAETLLKLLKDSGKYKITNHFDLDSAFVIIMRNWKQGFRHDAFADAISMKLYFNKRFEEVMKSEIPSLSAEAKLKQKNSAENIMNLIRKITSDFLTSDHYCGDKNGNTMFVASISRCSAEWSFLLREDDESYVETRKHVLEVLRMLCGKISKITAMEKYNLQFINHLLKFKWSDAQLRDLWIRRIKAELSSTMHRSWRDKDQFLEFYMQEIDKYDLHETMEECFDEYAFQCTEQLLKDFTRRKPSWFFMGSAESTVKSRLGKLFEKIFKKEYEKIFDTSVQESKVMKILRFVGGWPFISQFYEITYQEEAIKKSMPTEVKRNATKFLEDFRKTITSFQHGKMKISESAVFVKYGKPIMQLYNVMQNKGNHSGSTGVDNELQSMILVRQKHLKAISVTSRMVSDFISLCMELDEVQIKVNVDDIDGMSLMEDRIICDIVDPSSQPLNYENGLETVPNLNNDYLKEIKIISAVHESATFKAKWKHIAQEQCHVKSDEAVTCNLEKIITRIWPKVKATISDIITGIHNGTISVIDVLHLFSFTDGKRDLIDIEMSKLTVAGMLIGLNLTPQELKERCRQIQNVLLLKKKQKSSIVVSRLISILKLESDVHALKVIKDNEQLILREVDANVGDVLSHELWTNTEFMKILDTFVQQKHLISWLKDKMKDWSEVKLFCDLAMISADELSDEGDRVSFLLSSVNGFSPLLFDLPKEAGMIDLLNSCKAVWKNAKSDKHLSEKWRDTGRQLHWFQGVHEAHGSVGAQSLTMAKDINRHGVYFITREENSPLKVENCLRLSLVRQEEKERIAKDMTYSELKDLQSKLMLIAGDASKQDDEQGQGQQGQGQQDVSRFNDVLGAMANLAQRYINLINEGCMLFNSLTVTVQCFEKELIISLSFTKESDQISTTSSLKDLESLVEVLQEALSEWTTYIEKMRLKHYYLNDYNMQQIMYLCKKLAKSDFTDQVYSLLTNLKKQEVYQHAQQALDEATKIEEDEETTTDNSTIDNKQSSDSDRASARLEQKNRMVRELAKSGLNETLAKAAVQLEENEDVEDCTMWALENQHNETLVMQLSEKFEEEAGFGPDASHKANYISVLHNRTSVTLKELIADIQNSTTEKLNIYGAVQAICHSYNEKTSKLTLQDFLSIDHLGKFLRILREKLEPINGKIERRIDRPMQKGKANLILLPSQDMLYTTLALYEHNKEQPLPSRSEVLVCTEKTTEDEVGRFLRRAMLKNPCNEKRLFCMTSAEKLVFTVSSCVENLFSTLSGKDCVDSEYQLVILCSSNDQQHYLVTCFDRSRIDLKIPVEKKKLSQYVRSKLKPDLITMDVGQKSSVKLVKSERSGLGKSLHVERLTEKLKENDHSTIIRLLVDTINVDHILSRLHRNSRIMNEDPHLIHFDLTSAVQHGIEEFAFNLFVLRSIQDSQGRMWHHHPQHFYVIEMTVSKLLTANSVLNLIPCTECISPKQVLESAKGQMRMNNIILMDRKKFESETFQRPFQYLKRYDKKENLDQFQYSVPDESEEDCISVLLKHCGMQNPSWAQLYYFASFLNVQLINCEESIFCQKIEGNNQGEGEMVFPGLKNFAVHFMIKMAQDIATPSLHISDESGKTTGKQDDNDGLGQYQVRRKWENEAHPFVFFNEDHTTMTFLNVNVTSNGDILDVNGQISERNMVSRQLVNDLKRQKVPLGINFNTMSRKKKLRVLCQFMNIPRVFDPDPTYELTTDNVLKMIAIYMRLRSNIPVIIMGETGCGKTRMIEFMSKMRSGNNKSARNMVTVKVHGGVQVADIYESVVKAKKIAASNTENYNLSTILFYDEANTTVAIHAIKEVVCDLTIDGEDFKDSKLQIVAACNPYKRLSDAAVKKLEGSGLGYNIKASKTNHTGHVPMRRLVYRVVALPLSMQPFVWDFGQLGDDTEKIYICQMTTHLKEEIDLTEDDAELIAFVIFRVQCYMRKISSDVSRYVSLRDVERSLKVYEWFHEHAEHIFDEILEYHNQHKSGEKLCKLSPVHRCLLHTVSVCYHASLDNRESFRKELSKILREKSIFLSESDISAEITACQTQFVASLKMDDNIACNKALRENVFLMTVCTDLRIPLFVVGKPGSSKSLAKTIVADNMQGKTSHCDLYKHFKEVHVLSYQCSALTDAQGIESIFNQCSQLQSNQDINSYVAVVVLDEVGLAEDSANMPLKILHPLLECGSTKSGTLTDRDPKKKVGFVGISNWALDPAKMNRGIFVTRNSSDEKDLQKTARGIFESHKTAFNRHIKDFTALTDSYLQIYKRQGKEYFGLRDYYSLIKMLHAKFKEFNSTAISKTDVYNAVQRNFSGGRETEEHLNVFYKKLREKRSEVYNDPPSLLTLQEMVLSNLEDDKSRFLLLLANQYSSFTLLQSFIPNFHNNVQVIFGSSFPNDHSYTEMCRNINRVKVCMEAGRTVILLNLTDINESLYDALNQHYVTLGGQKYVDLGLGGHRVKCRIADGFRLIVVELKEKVFEEYPIPLINRLEKHHLDSSSLLSEKQKEIADELSDWIKKFACIREFKFKESDAFPGHNEDTVSSVVLSFNTDLTSYKSIFLQSASVDAVFRLPKCDLGIDDNDLLKIYIEDQFHDNLQSLLQDKITEPKMENEMLEGKKIASKQRVIQMEITTFSNILSDSDRMDLEKSLGTGTNSIMLVSLQQFQTEQDYLKKLDDFISFCNKNSDDNQKAAILLVQCPQAHKHVPLVACARYGLKNKLSQLSNNKRKVIIGLLLSTERKLTSDNSDKEEKGLSLQHVNDCEIIYVDELRSSHRSCGQMRGFHSKSICEMLELGRNSKANSGFSIQLLLQDCICEALTMVKSTVNEERNLKRIVILSELCSSDNKIGRDFVNVLTKKMIEIYQDRENNHTYEENWITQEACCAEKLQAGGPFANTLWLCLKEHVSHVLAYIISIADRNNNLDIFCESDVKMYNMWLQMFEACKMKWEYMKGCKEFTIKQGQYTHQREGIKIPFCYVLTETIEEQWNIVKDEPGDDESKRCMLLLSNVRSTNLTMHKAVGDALQLPKPLDLLKAYASELLEMTFSMSPVAAEILSSALELISRRYLPIKHSENDPESIRFVLIFYTLKKFQRQIQVAADVLNLCPEAEKDLKEWTAHLYKESHSTDSVILHQKAIEYALEKGKEKALAIKDDETCIEWMGFMTKLKTIFNSTLDLLEETIKEDQLNRRWKPLSMLDMLFLHLLPSPSSSQVQFKRYLDVVSSHAKLVFKGTLKHVLHGQQFLRIVCNVLRKHYEDVQLKVLLLWKNTTCRICNKDCKSPTILECGHYFCALCLQNTLLKSEEKNCFLCNATLPDDFEPLPAALNDVQREEVDMFQTSCTSFFLEYLSHFAFVSGVEGSGAPEIVKLIFDDLILNDDAKKSELEKVGLNLNLATKASIFLILMRYDSNKTKEVFNQHLVNDKYAGNLIFITLKHFDLALERNIVSTGDELLDECSKLLRRFEDVIKSQDMALSCVAIEAIAGAHYGIRQFVKIMNKKPLTGSKDKDDVALEQANRDSHFYNIKLVSDKVRELRELFVKVGCRTFGMEWFSKNSTNESFQELIPKYLKDSSHNAVDYFTSLGDSYSSMRADLNKTSVDKHTEKVKEWFPDDQPICFKKLLAAVTWLSNHQNGKDVLESRLLGIANSDAEVFTSMLAVVGNCWPMIKHSRKLSEQQISVLEQLILIIVGSVKFQDVLMGEMQMLMKDPASVAAMFWPAMPESFYFSIPQELRYESGENAMYRCPKGHFYTIGDCTRPWITSRCPDCNAKIGGKEHREEARNKKVERMEEKSQAGYKLLSSEKNMQQPQDRISQQATAVMQLMIHACMLLGLTENPNAESEIISDKKEDKDIMEHLIDEMLQNIKDFAHSIGRNLDQALLVLFGIMSSISDAQIPEETVKNVNWSSMESRRAWEICFRQKFFLPVFQTLDTTIVKAQQNLNAAENMAGLALFRLVHEVKEEKDLVVTTELRPKWWQNRHLWHFIEHPSASHLIQCIQDHPRLQTGSVLHTILETADIDLLQYLEDALKLQKMAIDRYQNELDLNDAEKTTLRNFQAENVEAQEMMPKYIAMWNKARIQAQSSDPNNETAGWFKDELTLDHPISAILPSSRGRGRCAKAITKYVLEIQNKFLSECFNIIGIKESNLEVDFSLLLPSDFVKVDKQRDLLPLIHLHTSHVVTEDAYGKHHVISYNVDALEKQARKNFVENKKMIRLESLPCIKYTQDVGIGSDWNNVKKRTKKQEALSARLVQILDDSVAQATPADICEGVRTLTHAISFLAKVDCEHERLLHEYLQKDLRLDRNRTTMIPRSAKIHHTLALYQHLSWHKAVNFVQQGLKPYKGALDEHNQELITDEHVLKEIKDAFQRMDVTLFQQRLNEMIVKVPDHKNDWSLREDILPNVEFIGYDGSDDSWFDRIPEEVCFKHISHIFELAVQHVQNQK